MILIARNQIVLGILVLHLDGQPVSPYGERVAETLRLGPTIYPIVFAALAARFFHSLARWAAERPRGIRLAALEQIYGSQSFAGTIERALFLRTNTMVAVATLLVWAMSPLGGQSSSRLMYSVSESNIGSATVYYTDIGKVMSSAIGSSGLTDTKSLIHNIYTSSLISPVTQRHGPLDMWGRPKIPIWDDSRGGEEDDGWIDVADQAASEQSDLYASLLGVNVYGLEHDNNTKYDILVNSTYINLDCEAVAFGITYNRSEEYFPADVLNVTSMQKSDYKSDPTRDCRKPDDHTSFRAGYGYPHNVIGVGTPDFKPPALLYASKDLYYGRGQTGTSFSLFNCTMTPVAVKTSIRCGPLAQTGCAAHRQRRLPHDGPANSMWPENMVDTALTITLGEWPVAQGDFDNYMASPTDNYLAGDDNLFLGQDIRQWNGTDMRFFSRRITTAFNTMWQATLNPRNATNPDPAGSQPSQPYRGTTRTEARTAVERNIYRASRPWITVLFVATLILQALAVAGVVLDKLVLRAPDIMGYVSSSTRDNAFFPLPMSGSTLGGTERARLLGGVRVRIADVRPGEDVGYIAFERAVPDVPWAPLNRRREYL